MRAICSYPLPLIPASMPPESLSQVAANDSPSRYPVARCIVLIEALRQERFDLRCIARADHNRVHCDLLQHE